MSDIPVKNEPAANAGEANDNLDAAFEAAFGSPDQGPLEGRVRALEAELAEYKDKALRALAEAENVRRRTEREKEEASKYAVANFAREMLSVADNLRRALDSMPDGLREQDAAAANLVVGIEMTERAMQAGLERFGIRSIEALGKKVDPNYHEALFEIEDPAQPAGTIVQVVDKGYLIHDRLLRPARVGVAKGGPREASPPAGEPQEPPRPSAANPYERQSDAQRADDPSRPNIDREV